MVIRSTFSRGSIGPSLKGRVYSYRNEKGEISASWPSAPGKARSALQAQNMELFRQACIAMKLMAPQFIAYAAKDAKGKPMLPRDSLMAALYGKGPTIYLNNGKVLRPMATRVDMSSVMDNIAWRKWSMLVRYEDMWEGLDPPDDYCVLVFDPVEGPVWVFADDFGSSGVWLVPYGTNVTTLNKNLKGNVWDVFQDQVIDAMQCKHSLNAGTVYNWFIAEMGPGNAFTQILLDTPHPAPAVGGTQAVFFQFPTAMTLFSGKTYFVGMYVPGAAATFNNPLFNGNLGNTQLSVLQNQSRWAEATNTPGLGTVPDFDSSNTLYCVGIRGR